MCPLVKAFQAEKDAFRTLVCVTGQHREMLDQVLHLFDVRPDYDLNIMQQGQDLYDITSRVLLGLRDILKEVKPDVVFVHADTSTSPAAALAAFYKQMSQAVNPYGDGKACERIINFFRYSGIPLSRYPEKTD